MDNKAPIPHSTVAIYELQFDGDKFSTNPDENQPFWPRHNYTKEIRITNQIYVQIQDKEFLAKVKSGEIQIIRTDTIEARLEQNGSNYVVTKVLKHTKNIKQEFNKI
jgi:hypothetical protein